MSREVTDVRHHDTHPVELTLRTEDTGSVKDKMTLLMGAFMKVSMAPAKIIQIRKADFDEDPCIVVIVEDPVLRNLPRGTIRADVRPAHMPAAA